MTYAVAVAAGPIHPVLSPFSGESARLHTLTGLLIRRALWCSSLMLVVFVLLGVWSAVSVVFALPMGHLLARLGDPAVARVENHAPEREDATSSTGPREPELLGS